MCKPETIEEVEQYKSAFSQVLQTRIQIKKVRQNGGLIIIHAIPDGYDREFLFTLIELSDFKKETT